MMATDLICLGMNTNTWSTAETVLAWCMRGPPTGGGSAKLPDVAVVQETRIKTASKGFHGIGLGGEGWLAAVSWAGGEHGR
eukprot:8192966-Pyramimonas_sp.AAC.1